MGFLSKLLGGDSGGVPFPDSVLAIRLPHQEGCRRTDAELARQRPPVARSWVAPSGTLQSEGDADCEAVLHLCDMFAIATILSPGFSCPQDDITDARVLFDATARIVDLAKLVSLSPIWVAAPNDDKDSRPGKTLYIEQVSGTLGGRIGALLASAGYSFGALGKLSPSDATGILGGAFEDVGLQLVSVSGWSVSSETFRDRQTALNEANIAKAQCSKEKLVFALEQQLRAQEHAVELAEAEQRIELAREAQRYELDREIHFARVAELNEETNRVKLATRKAEQELRRASEEADRAASDAEAARIFRERVPQVLETAYRDFVETQVAGLGDAMQETMAGVIEQLQNTLAANTQALASAGHAAIESTERFSSLLTSAQHSISQNAARVETEAKNLADAMAEGAERTKQTTATVENAGSRLEDSMGASAQRMEGLLDRILHMGESLADKARMLDEQYAWLLEEAPAMPGGARVAAQLFQLFHDLAEAKTEGKGDRLQDVLGAFSREKEGRPLDPRASMIADKALEALAPDLPTQKLHAGASRARFLDSVRNGIQTLAPSSLAVRVNLILYDKDNQRQRTLDNAADRVGTRGSTFARKSPIVGEEDSYRIKFTPTISGYLWVIAVGRFPDEKPRLLYPLRGDLARGLGSARVRVQADCQTTFPKCVPVLEDFGMDRLMLDDATGEEDELREKIIVIVTKHADGLAVSEKRGDGDQVPIHLVDLTLPEDHDPPGDSVPAYLASGELAFDPDCVCGMIEFPVAKPRGSQE